MTTNKLWGGRFTQQTAPDLEQLNCSIIQDKRLYAEDIEGSQAYAKCIRDIDLISSNDCADICEGLEKIKVEWDNNQFEIKSGDEDIHTANERRLKELIGEAATRLHVGRSRNDQVITDMKLWMKKAIKELYSLLKNVGNVMVSRALAEIDYIMPGYTHLQRAQPVRWSHWLLSHTWNLKNDSDKLIGLFESVDVLPLGSGALAGNPFNINRKYLADLLNFQKITPNSMQAVGDRDFIADFLYWSSLVGIHLSQLAEDMILFSTKEFSFITMDDSYSTGSSLMPQKRNPDSLELIRGIGGSLFGSCCSFMMSLKGLPSTYNKDLQCDKEYVFNTFDKLEMLLRVTEGTIKTLKVNADVCREALSYEMLATDLAYYLVRKSVPFRQAHHLAGKVVSAAEKKDVLIKDLTLEELKLISCQFDADVAKIWNYEYSIEQYQVEGGTSKQSVLDQISKLNEWIECDKFHCQK